MTSDSRLRRSVLRTASEGTPASCRARLATADLRQLSSTVTHDTSCKVQPEASDHVKQRHPRAARRRYDAFGAGRSAVVVGMHGLWVAVVVRSDASARCGATTNDDNLVVDDVGHGLDRQGGLRGGRGGLDGLRLGHSQGWRHRLFQASPLPRPWQRRGRQSRSEHGHQCSTCGPIFRASA